MFLDESAFEMQDNPYLPSANMRSDSNNSSRPGTGTSLDMSKGRYGGKASMSDSMTPTVLNDDDDDDSMFNRNSINGMNSTSNSRARMLAQQRDIQLKKRMSAVQAGGMVRSSFENPLAMPGKASSSRQNGDNQSIPAVRQFSAPKAMESSEFTNPGEFSGRRSGEETLSSIRDKRPPTDRPPRRSFVDDDEDDDDIHARRGNGSRHTRDQHHLSDDDDVPSRSSRQTNQPARHQQPRDRPPRRAYDDASDEEDISSYQPAHRRDNHTSSRRPHESDDDDYDNRQQRRGNSKQPTGRRNSRSPDDNDDDDRDDHSWDQQQQQRGGNRGGGGRRGEYDDHNDNRRQQQQSRQQHQQLYHHRERDDSPAARSDATSTSATTSTPMPVVAVPLNLSNMRNFLTTPIPKSAGTVQCYIRRTKTATSLYPTYNLYLKDGDRFLLTSKKRLNNKTSNYLISMVYNEHNRESNSYLGKVRSNFVGTEFQLFDNGVNPEKNDGSVEGNVRKDLGAVMYAANILGTRGPRKMQVSLPAVDENDRILSWNAAGKEGSQDDMLTRIKDRNFRDLVYLINKPPRWNEQVGAYVLNFNGRVTMASVKNFQLVDPDEQNAVVLQFGRVAKDEFSMDMQWPVSPLQAFAITMTSFDSKIACD